MLFLFFFIRIEDSSCDTKDTETNKAESCNDRNQIKIKNLVFSQKVLILTVLTTICIFLGIILLTLFLIFGNRLQVKEGEYGNKPRISDGDDSRRITPINSTIGKKSKTSTSLMNLFVLFTF